MKVEPIIPSLAVILLILMAAGIALGETPLGFAGYLQAVTAPESSAGDIVWSLRAPRVVTAALVGAALGVAGAVMQGLLRNPLADPGVLGVSAGGGLGAANRGKARVQAPPPR